MNLYFILRNEEEICFFPANEEFPDQPPPQFIPTFVPALNQLESLRRSFPDHKYTLHSVNCGKITGHSVDGAWVNL